MEVVPNLCCVVGYINDPGYLPEDESSKKIRRLRLREANVKLRATAVRSK